MTGGGAEHEKRLKDFFGAYDLNGDGEITREELFKAMKRAIGYNDVATNQIVDVSDPFPLFTPFPFQPIVQVL